jgi:putative endonuclease
MTPCWYLYLLECEDGTLYTGITTDVARRFAQHLKGTGARYTRSHPPRRVLAWAQVGSRSQALRAECQLKAQPKAQKLAYIERLATEQVDPSKNTAEHD